MWTAWTWVRKDPIAAFCDPDHRARRSLQERFTSAAMWRTWSSEIFVAVICHESLRSYELVWSYEFCCRQGSDLLQLMVYSCYKASTTFPVPLLMYWLYFFCCRHIPFSVAISQFCVGVLCGVPGTYEMLLHTAPTIALIISDILSYCSYMFRRIQTIIREFHTNVKTSQNTNGHHNSSYCIALSLQLKLIIWFI